jgi:uncharacterized membrane protein YagU involved in acid resistance
MNSNLGKTILAGLLATTAMTMLMLAAPLMGMPPMNIGAMLRSKKGGMVALVGLAHFMIGTILAVAYGLWFADWLPGAPAARGALFALLPWLVAQLVMMPMMGMGLFSGSVMAALGSLMGHLVYGAVLGGVVGVAGSERVTAA